jgi:DNA-binding transcriptional ArsR family regulator
MRGEPDLAALAALIGDPARARILTALMSGTALTATELALEAGVAPSTASSHLAKLTGAHVVEVEQQGRHRYFRLADARTAEVLEELTGLAAQLPRRRPGPADPALRLARVCYDHLAGERGVWLLDTLRARNFLTDRLHISPDGEAFFTRLGIDVGALSQSRRPLCRPCLDWSERRHHLGGALGAAMLQRMFALRWARREPHGRVVVFSREGERALATL